MLLFFYLEHEFLPLPSLILPPLSTFFFPVIFSPLVSLVSFSPIFRLCVSPASIFVAAAFLRLLSNLVLDAWCQLFLVALTRRRLRSLFSQL